MLGIGSPGFFRENEPVQRLLWTAFAADAVLVDRADFLPARSHHRIARRFQSSAYRPQYLFLRQLPQAATRHSAVLLRSPPFRRHPIAIRGPAARPSERCRQICRSWRGAVSRTETLPCRPPAPEDRFLFVLRDALPLKEDEAEIVFGNDVVLGGAENVPVPSFCQILVDATAAVIDIAERTQRARKPIFSAHAVNIVRFVVAAGGVDRSRVIDEDTQAVGNLLECAEAAGTVFSGTMW